MKIKEKILKKIRTQMTFFFLPKSGFAFWSIPDFFYIKKQGSLHLPTQCKLG